MSQNMNPADTNARTRECFDSILVEMRHLDAVRPDTSLSLYGESFSTPIMMAALSHLKGKDDNGMVEMAIAAKRLNAVMWAGMGSRDELARITDTGARTIKIIKPYADNERVLRKIEHAEQHGCIAVGMDVDHSFNGSGDYDVVLGDAMTPRSLDDIRAYVKSTKLPFIIKGVLGAHDAKKCLDAGVSGIVVSHHHGIMPFAVPPLLVLPEIVDAVGGKMDIFVDCGVSTGMDVFKALALGATAVSAGRVVMGPLAAEGPEGIVRVIESMTRELAGAMARTASPDIRGIDASLLWREGGRLR